MSKKPKSQPTSPQSRDGDLLGSVLYRFVQLLTEPGVEALVYKTFLSDGSTTPESILLIRSLVRMCRYHSFTETLIEPLLARSLDLVNGPELLFRSDDFTTAIIREYINQTCDPELPTAVAAALRQLKHDTDASNSRVAKTASRLLDALSSFSIPIDLQWLFSVVQKVVGLKFPGSEEFGIISLFFLRYFCPLVVSPPADLCTKSKSKSKSKKLSHIRGSSSSNNISDHLISRAPLSTISQSVESTSTSMVSPSSLSSSSSSSSSTSSSCSPPSSEALPARPFVNPRNNIRVAKLIQTLANQSSPVQTTGHVEAFLSAKNYKRMRVFLDRLLVRLATPPINNFIPTVREVNEFFLLITDKSSHIRKALSTLQQPRLDSLWLDISLNWAAVANKLVMLSCRNPEITFYRPSWSQAMPDITYSPSSPSTSTRSVAFLPRLDDSSLKHSRSDMGLCRTMSTSSSVDDFCTNNSVRHSRQRGRLSTPPGPSILLTTVASEVHDDHPDDSVEAADADADAADADADAAVVVAAAADDDSHVSKPESNEKPRPKISLHLNFTELEIGVHSSHSSSPPKPALSPAPLSRWDHHRVIQWLDENDLQPFIQSFEEQGVTGAVLEKGDFLPPRVDPELRARFLTAYDELLKSKT